MHRFVVLAALASMCALLVGCGCGPGGECEYSLPNGYMLVSISGGPKVYILDSTSETVLSPEPGWSVATYGVSGKAVAGTIESATSPDRYFLLDTDTGSVRMFNSMIELSDAWSASYTQPAPKLQHWSQPP